jgi:hypothetical protein
VKAQRRIVDMVEPDSKGHNREQGYDEQVIADQKARAFDYRGLRSNLRCNDGAGVAGS